MSLAIPERRAMRAGVHHPYYRITRSTVPGYWVGTCKVCSPPRPTKNRPSVGQAEQSVREHLKDVHGIEER